MAQDIGTILTVPPEERMDADPDPQEVGEANEDAGADLSHVPEGTFVDLTDGEDDDEPIGEGEPDDEPDEYPESLSFDEEGDD